MFIHTIDPVLFKIGFLEIRYYGLVYFLGFMLVFFLLRKHKKELGLEEENIYDFIIYLFLGLFIGARIFYFLFSEPYTILNSPLEFFKIWKGGMSFFGSLIGILIAGYIFCKKRKLDFYKLGDFVVIPATFGLFLGRIANFLNGEFAGTITNVNWCVIFKNYFGCRHPYQLYAALSHLVLLFLLLKIKSIKESKKLKEGIVLISFIILYSLFRFFTDFFRENPRLLGLTGWQFMSILFFLFGLTWLYKKYKKQ